MSNLPSWMQGAETEPPVPSGKPRFPESTDPNRITCQECGYASMKNRATCKQCKAPLDHPSVPVAAPALAPLATTPRTAKASGLSVEERNAILQKQITQYVKQGWRVVSQTDTTAQLVKPKQFSCLLASLSLLAVGIGFLFYMFWYASQKDQQLYISVGLDGKVTRTK